MDRNLIVVLPGSLGDAFLHLDETVTRTGLSLTNPALGSAVAHEPPNYELTTFPEDEVHQRVVSGTSTSVQYWLNEPAANLDTFITWKPHAYGWEFSMTLSGLNPQLVGALLAGFAELTLYTLRQKYGEGIVLRVEFAD
jgi:hypothetical protein